MTQILSSSIKLNEQQVETTINNLVAIRHFTKKEKIFEGKPNFSTQQIELLKKKVSDKIEITKVTKFANNYTIYVLSNPKPAKYTEELRKYNKDVKILNLNERTEILIVLDSNKFDKQHYLAIIGFWDKIEPYLKDAKPDDCLVTIVSTNIITQAISKHFQSSMILPCNYRLFSLCEVYPLIGSRNTLWCGSSRDFELLEHEDLYNKNKYQIIFDDDPVVKILNAQKDQLIICKQTYFEVSPYSEYVIRKVTQRLNDSESLDISGLHIEEEEEE